VILKLFHFKTFINNISALLKAINFGNYGVVFDHKSRLGPNYWLLFKAKMRKEHQNKHVFKQNIYQQNVSKFSEYFFKISEKTKFCGVEKDSSVTISVLQKKQGVERTWLRRASAAHLCITLSCKTDVCNAPSSISLWKKMMLGSKTTPAFNF